MISTLPLSKGTTESRGFYINVLIKEWNVLDTSFKVIIKIAHEKQKFRQMYTATFCSIFFVHHRRNLKSCFFVFNYSKYVI